MTLQTLTGASVAAGDIPTDRAPDVITRGTRTFKFQRWHHDGVKMIAVYTECYAVELIDGMVTRC